MNLKHIVSAVVLVAATTQLAACGTSDEEVAVKNLKASIIEEEFGGPHLTDEQAGCMAEGIVEAVQVDNLKNKDILNGEKLTVDEDELDSFEPTDKQGDKIAKTLLSCDDSDELIAANVQAEILKEDVAGASLSEAQASCLADGIAEGVGGESLFDSGLLNFKLDVNGSEGLTDVTFDKDDADAVAKAFTGCFDAEKLIEEQFAQAAPGMTDEQQACIKEVLTRDVVEEVLSLTFQGKPNEISGALREGLRTCVSGS